MKNLLITLGLGITLIPSVFASGHDNKGSKKAKDTINIKCELYSPNLYYGIELGEKPTATMVDTLVGEIENYDTDANLNLVVITAQNLGFTNQTNILWEQILDSAQKRGFGICPAQIGPELYVLSQNIPSQKKLLSSSVINNRPIFVGMDKIRHTLNKLKKNGYHPFRHRDFFDYVFCIKSDNQKHEYELGYCATNSTTAGEAFVWNYNDKFIFVNKPHSCNLSVSYSSR